MLIVNHIMLWERGGCGKVSILLDKQLTDKRNCILVVNNLIWVGKHKYLKCGGLAL